MKPKRSDITVAMVQVNPRVLFRFTCHGCGWAVDGTYERGSAAADRHRCVGCITKHYPRPHDQQATPYGDMIWKPN